MSTLSLESSGIKLRDYQNEAISQIHQGFIQGKSGLFLVAPTGAGKTVIFSSLTEAWVKSGATVCILAHRSELIKQASKTISRNGLFHGIIKAGPSTNPQAPIQICSIDSMRNRMLPTDPDFIILDEAHLGKSKRYTNFLKKYWKAKRLLVSATPWRLDGSGFHDLVDDLLICCTTNDLIHHPNGPFLVPPKLYTGSDLGDMDSQISTIHGDYNEGELAEFMSKVTLVGDIIQKYNQLAPGRKGIVFCVNIAHSKLVRDQFIEAGIKAEHLDGTMKESDREAILKRLSTGETSIVCNCNVLSEGFDEPSISYIGLARPTKSLSLYIQQVGRGLRINEGKQDCVIIDHAQNVDQHGHILEERDWYLDGKKEAKKSKTKPKYCPKCDCIIPKLGYKCPACGWHRITSLQVNTIDCGSTESQLEHPLKTRYRVMMRWLKNRNAKDSDPRTHKTPFWVQKNMLEEFIVKQNGTPTEFHAVLNRVTLQKIHEEVGI